MIPVGVSDPGRSESEVTEVHDSIPANDGWPLLGLFFILLASLLRCCSEKEMLREATGAGPVHGLPGVDPPLELWPKELLFDCREMCEVD